jgi:hypothetical protein
MSAHASSRASALPALHPVRVGIVTAGELEGRRLADVLARGGLSSVSCYRNASGLVADAVAIDVLVASTRRGGTAIDELVHWETPVVFVGGSLTRRAVDEALEVGVRGFVAEEHLESRLVATVVAVASGRS